MSETMGLWKIAMLALIFNAMMIGVFGFVEEAELSDVSCQGTGGFEANFTVSGVCEPAGMPWEFYAFWAIINGVVVYAFIPFVK